MKLRIIERAEETYCFYILDEDKHVVDFYPMSLKTVVGVLRKAGKEIFSEAGKDWSFWIGQWRDGTDSTYKKPAKYAAVATRKGKDNGDFDYIEDIDKFISKYGDKKTLAFWKSNYRNYYDMDKAKQESYSCSLRKEEYSPYKKYTSEYMADKICKLIGRSQPFEEGTDEILTDIERFFNIDLGFSQSDRFLDWEEIEDDVFNELSGQPLDLLMAYYNNL